MITTSAIPSERPRPTRTGCQMYFLLPQDAATALHLHRVIPEANLHRRARAESNFLLGIDRQLLRSEAGVGVVLCRSQLHVADQSENRRRAGLVTSIGRETPLLLRRLKI